MEKKIDVFNLTWIRRDAEIKAQKKKEEQPKGWFSGVSSWWGGAKPQNDPGWNIILSKKNTSNVFLIELDVQKMMSPEEKKKLFDAIGYEGEDISKSSYPKTVSLGSLNQIDLFPKISVCGYRYEYSIEIIGCEYLVETQ